MKLALLPVVVAVLPASSFAQKTIHVPGDAPSIQIGIAIADDGDTVLVSPGWYYEQLDFLGRAITLKSTDGPEVTRITPERSHGWLDQPYHSTIRFISGEGSNSVLEGFTIIGPSPEFYVYPEAGVWCESANPTIRHCTIQDGSYSRGVYGDATLESCIIRNNNGGYWDGGGVSGSPTMTNCVIESNHGYSGGGIEASGAVIRNCIIRNNSAGEGGRGGGIVCGSGNVIENCIIYENKTTWPEFDGHGAGVYASGANNIIKNCVVWENEINSWFGGVSGIDGTASTIVTNCIIANNISTATPAPQILGATLTYCNAEGGYPGLGNIDAPSLFVNPTSGDFRLLPYSPCIDAGDPLGLLDADGTRADMGAFALDQYPSCVPAKVPVAATIAFDHVGSAVAAGGSYVIAGTPDVNGPGFESGAAFMAYRDGPAWVALPKLIASDETTGALFGASVALDTGVAWIGAPGVASESGAAYAFRQEEDGSWAEEIKLMASDGTPGSRLGTRVAVHGDLAAASAPLANAPGADSGAVYVFEDGATGWSEIDKLTALDAAAGDHFGSGLALSGNRLLIGAEGDAAGAGSAYIFEDQGFGWGQQAKLVASDASASELFGHAVALEGDVALVGAPAADGVGAAYVFRRSGFSWIQEQKLVASTPSQNAEFGGSVAVAGNRIVVGARSDDGAASNAGAAFLFEFNGTTWIQTLKYTLPGASAGDAAGSGVALSGDYVLVGAEWADDPELDAGELWAFAAPGTCEPKFQQVPGALAQDPEPVTALGTYLSQVQEVTIGGIPVPVLTATDTTITYQPHTDAPGFLPLVASGPEGTGFAEQEMFPSLTASTTGVGGTLQLSLDNGTGGLYALAMGLGSLPVPVSIANPPTWYGVLLNPAAPLFVIGTGAFATSDPIALSYPVPSKPELTGLALYLQAWCQQGFFGPEVTYSFTNLTVVTL